MAYKYQRNDKVRVKSGYRKGEEGTISAIYGYKDNPYEVKFANGERICYRTSQLEFAQKKEESTVEKAAVVSTRRLPPWTAALSRTRT